MRVRFVCMKMKRLQIYLSLLSLLHLLLLTSGATLINEVFKDVRSERVLIASCVTTIFLLVGIVGIYVATFLGSKNK